MTGMRVVSLLGAALVALSAASAQVSGGADTVAAGPAPLPLFDPAQPPCNPPPAVKRSLAFVQDNGRQFMRGVDLGLSAAARDRGLDYNVALADNDAQRMLAQVEALSADRVGAMIVAPVDPALIGPALERYMHTGGYVGAIVPPPATTILNAPQYLTGKVIGDAAARYIEETWSGEANVVLLTHDSLQFLSPRFAAIRDALARLPNATIVADISPVTVDDAGGAAMMNTILLANPHIDVVLGADAVVIGALKALRAAGKERPDQFLGGIDGEPEAIAEIKRGGAYKLTVGLNSPVFAYALGQHAADWIEGRRVPQAMDILPVPIMREGVAQYEADLAEPAAVYRDATRRAQYLRMYGSICYDERAHYMSYPWSSERP